MDDLAALLRIVAGPDPSGEGFEVAFPLGDHEALDFKQLTVFPLEHGGSKVQPSLRDVVRRAARVLEARGARVERLRSDLLKDALWIWGAMMSVVSDRTYAELVSGDPELPILRELLRIPFGRSHHTAPVLALIAGQRLMQLLPDRSNDKLVTLGRSLQREIESKLGDRGVLLHPPYARTAPVHGRPLLRPLDVGFTAVFNVLELPSTQIPAGLDAQGLPLGVQVVGARGRDHLCLGVARALEEEFGVLTPIDPRKKAQPS